jgi:K+-sensing histidine kinase KdpD
MAFAMSIAAVVLTTTALFTIDAYLAVQSSVLGYLLPTIFMAIYFGSTVAALTSIASGLAAAYFLLPPAFSFQVTDTRHIAELGFVLLLALTASKAIGILYPGGSAK